MTYSSDSTSLHPVSRFRALGWMLLLTVLIAGCAHRGGGRPIKPLEFIQGWAAEVVAPPPQTLPSHRDTADASATDSPYGLYLLTRGGGLSVREGKLHFQMSEEDLRWEHAWLVLESPDEWREIGVTNMRNLLEVYTYEVLRAAVNGQRNPVSRLRARMDSSTVHTDVKNGKPDFALHLPLTPRQHAQLRQYLDSYDYGYYTLDDHNCTSFVSDAARLVGLPVHDRMRVQIPQSISIHGSQPVPLWHEPEFGEFIMATPSVLEQSLKDLVAKGVGQDGRERYLQRRPQPVEDAAPALGATPAATPEPTAGTP